jgi:hypothetical protein
MKVVGWMKWKQFHILKMGDPSIELQVRELPAEAFFAFLAFSF